MDEDVAPETEPNEQADLVEQPDVDETKEEGEPGKVQEVTPEPETN